MQNTSPRVRSTALGYTIPTTQSHQQQQRTESGETSGLGMGSGGATNGSPAGFAATSSAGPSKKSLPANGKKTKGRVKIKMEFIDNKLRRYTTFSKRKTGIMKKAYELSTLTGTQVMLLVASETGHVYTFATRKLQPMITSEAGKALIQTCLNSPDPPPGPGSSGLDQRMSATGFEETDLTYTVGEDCEKISDGRYCNYSSSPDSPNSTEENSSNLMKSPSPQLVQVTVDGKVDASSQRQSLSTSSTGFATILAAAPGSNLSSAVQIGAFHSNSESPSAGQSENSSSVYRIPSQTATQPFALTISGTAKNSSASSNSNQNSNQNSISVVQNAHPNLSLLSGNVVIPAGQTLLQSGANAAAGNNVQGAFMYHTPQGLMYATPASLPEGVILNLGQDQGAQQYISIPLSLSLTPAQQQQLMQATATSGQSPSGTPPKKSKK